MGKMKNTKKNRKNNLRRKQIKSNKKGGGFFFGSSKKTEKPPPAVSSYQPQPILEEKVGENEVCQAEIQNKKITFENGETKRNKKICNSEQLKCLDANYILV